MPILKKCPDQFVAIPNETARHSQLSITAIGALVRMTSYPHDFRFRVTWLQKDWSMGRDKVRDILRELRVHGFLKTEAHLNGDGKLDGQTWWVSTTPSFLGATEAESGAVFTVPRNPRSTENTERINKEGTLNKEIEDAIGAGGFDAPAPHETTSLVLPPAKKKSKAKAPLTVEEVTAELASFPVYAHINVAHEVGKALVWLAGKPSRKFSRQFMVNWLNGIDPPIQQSNVILSIPDLPNGKHYPIPPEKQFDMQAMEAEWIQQGGISQ